MGRKFYQIAAVKKLTGTVFRKVVEELHPATLAMEIDQMMREFPEPLWRVSWTKCNQEHYQNYLEVTYP